MSLVRAPLKAIFKSASLHREGRITLEFTFSKLEDFKTLHFSYTPRAWSGPGEHRPIYQITLELRENSLEKCRQLCAFIPGSIRNASNTLIEFNSDHIDEIKNAFAKIQQLIAFNTQDLERIDYLIQYCILLPADYYSVLEKIVDDYNPQLALELLEKYKANEKSALYLRLAEKFVEKGFKTWAFRAYAAIPAPELNAKDLRQQNYQLAQYHLGLLSLPTADSNPPSLIEQHQAYTYFMNAGEAGQKPLKQLFGQIASTDSADASLFADSLKTIEPNFETFYALCLARKTARQKVQVLETENQKLRAELAALKQAQALVEAKKNPITEPEASATEAADLQPTASFSVATLMSKLGIRQNNPGEAKTNPSLNPEEGGPALSENRTTCRTRPFSKL